MDREGFFHKVPPYIFSNQPIAKLCKKRYPALEYRLR